MQQADVVIAGAGIVGLSLALELNRRGRSVTVIERKEPGSGASTAAAGMLAAHDSNNPPELLQLAECSLQLYPGYLAELERSGGLRVDFETEWTLERTHSEASEDVSGASALPLLFSQAGSFRLHRERSLDPRKLFASLLSATGQSGVTVLAGRGVATARTDKESVCVLLDDGEELACRDFIDCTGAWSTGIARPIKGQMLRLQMPDGALRSECKGNVVVRTPEIYLVPRLDGTCLVGATVENVGFDTEVRAEAKRWLRGRASELLHGIETWPEIESWCGLRPGTTNTLPVLGAVSEHSFVANGLYRNGILLAPAVAESIAALVQGEPSKVDLSAFVPRQLDAQSAPSEIPLRSCTI